MRIVIIGAGDVGTFLAKGLSAEHDIIVIEKNKEKVERIKESLDVLVIHGDGDNPAILKEAEIEKADIVLAVSGDDRTNILSSHLAHSFGISRVIARIDDPNYLEYPKLFRREEIFTVNSGAILAEKITGLISAPFAWRTEKFAMGKIQMLKLKIEEGTPIVGKKLSELGPPKAWIFVAISRKGKITIPTGETSLKAGDYIFALGIPSVLARLEELLGVKEKGIESVVIMGGGRLGRIVARNLSEHGISVKLIESNPQRAKATAEELPNVLVFNGDGTDSETLKDAGATSADYFIALTGDDENNVLSALLAKNLGTKRNIVLYTKSDYINVIESIGVDRAISMRLVTANEILSCLHLGGVTHVALLEEGKAEVLEFELTKNTKILGTPLKEADFPTGAIVGIVVRGNDVIIPRGEFVPLIGDRLIIFALPEAIKKVEKILG
ncbi:MAG: potassium transporter peripheral membrane component [Candidatus Dadabacteria bacterium CSP1-2]|jgi:trk system potassium uptake protein TrkA|nr:MAG: potassium transporter peripheral membrane component [Candidatus Dadabacteria bacterium CSP1-2]